MKNKKPSPMPAPFSETAAEYPSHRNPLFYGTLILSFGFAFTIYLMTLAPTVTFEDSGELISAAFLLGVPHEPGYPLFTLLGHLFTFIPLGSIAYRVNMMSAFFSSLGAMFATWSAVLLIEYVFHSKTFASVSTRRTVTYAAGLAAGVFTASGFSNWEQSIITEVYGLHTMFVGLLLLETILWSRVADPASRTRIFYVTCLTFGLALSNHPTTILLIPPLFLHAIVTDRKFMLNVRRFFAGSACMLLGMLPYLYLPIASARDPLMDWGNPETPLNFWRTITRHQYRSHDPETFGKFISQSAAYVSLLFQQWFPWFLLFAVAALFVLFKYRRNYFYFSLFFLFFTVPVTTYITNFDVTAGNPMVSAENKALVSVFYIPSYIYLSALMAMGIFYLVHLVPKIRIRPIFQAVLLLGLPLSYVGVNYRQLDMSRYVFTSDYIHNLFSVVSKGALVLVNWDPFSFPLNYYQFVENERRDVTVIDQELLRRSWYIQSLKDHFPDLIAPSGEEVEEFLRAVRPFEDGEPFDPAFIQGKYTAMLNAFIDRAMDSGQRVYMTYDPPAGVAEDYFKESVIAAVKLRKNMNDLTPIAVDSLQFRNYFDPEVPLDRMAKFFKTYYGRLFFARAFAAERLGLKDEAIGLYKAAGFLNDNPAFLERIRKAIAKLQ